jgi:hypothetical protein
METAIMQVSAIMSWWESEADPGPGTAVWAGSGFRLLIRADSKSTGLFKPLY